MAEGLAAERALEQAIEKLGIKGKDGEGLLANALADKIHETDDIKDYHFKDLELPQEIIDAIAAQ